MTGHMPDMNECGIEIFWHGMYRNIRARVLEMRGNPKHTPLEKLVKYALRAGEGILEAIEERSREKEGQKEGRTWGRFANRAGGSRPW